MYATCSDLVSDLQEQAEEIVTDKTLNEDLVALEDSLAKLPVVCASTNPFYQKDPEEVSVVSSSSNPFAQKDPVETEEPEVSDIPLSNLDLFESLVTKFC